MQETDELAEIFSEEKVGSYVVKGWTLRQFQALVPIIMECLDTLKAKGIAWDDLGEDQGKTLQVMQEIMAALVPRADTILAISLGISAQEAGDLDLPTASLLLLKVVSKNIDQLKNLPARVMEIVGAVIPGDS